MTYGYAGMRCYRVYDWHPSKKTNVIGALVDKCLLIVSIFDCDINTAIFNCLIEQDLIQKLPNNSVVIVGNASFHKHTHLKITAKSL
ncbi:transposase [Orientia tsutsugamushi]|uniref:transposase n=1 Tax=Orientia tsutsugamushi TaxID=784 RepID=UPI003527C1CB